MIMETELSEEVSEKAIETDSNTNICIKYESEDQIQPHLEVFPFSTENELKATNKLDISDIFCMENLVKSELVEFDQIDASNDILNETATAMVLLEKIPKTETQILGDDPVSASDEEFDLHHKDNYSEDSDLNSDPEHDPFADVDCGSSFSQNPTISHSSIGTSAAQNKQTKDTSQLCVICNKQFSTAQSYIFHALKIHGTNEAISSRYSFKCQFCTSCFPSNESLNAHVTSTHETNKTNESQKNQRRFKCPMPNCEEAFNFNGRLQNHLTNDHSKERSFKCQELNCGKTFKINGQLQRHMLFHLEGRPFKCPYADCHSAFNNNDFLTQHLQDHTKARQYREVAKKLFKCEHCDRAFPKNYQLNSHRLTHPKEIFQCPDPNCDRQFKYKKNCNSHFAYKHSNQDTPPLQCPEPNSEKILENKNSGSIYVHFLASLHKKTVQAVSFKCSEPNCGKRFKTKSYLREHLKNHTRQFKTNYFL